MDKLKVDDLSEPKHLLWRTKAGVLRKKKGCASQEEAEAALFDLHTTALGRAGDPIAVDTLRYTLTFPAERYVAAAAAIREAVAAKTKEPATDNAEPTRSRVLRSALLVLSVAAPPGAFA